MICKKYETLLFAFLMAMVMSGVMSLFITFINLGFVDGFVIFWLSAYWKAFAVAFSTILFIVPRVTKVVSLMIIK